MIARGSQWMSWWATAVEALVLVLVLVSAAPTPLVASATGDSEVAKTRDVRYREAREKFEKGDFKGAADISRQLIEAKQLSPALFELMGHLNYRQDKLGEAALWYERAALFGKPSVELRQNISHIHNRTGSVNMLNNRFRDQYAAYFSRSEWFYGFAICGWCFVFALVLYYFSPRRSGRRTFFMLVRVLALGGMTLTALGWYWKPSFEKVREIAAVTASDVVAYTSAAKTSGVVMKVPEGSDVRRLHERGAWTYVEIPTKDDFSRGWVTSDVLTSLWPYEAGYLE